MHAMSTIGVTLYGTSRGFIIRWKFKNLDEPRMIFFGIVLLKTVLVMLTITYCHYYQLLISHKISTMITHLDPKKGTKSKHLL